MTYVAGSQTGSRAVKEESQSTRSRIDLDYTRRVVVQRVASRGVMKMATAHDPSGLLVTIKRKGEKGEKTWLR